MTCLELLVRHFQLFVSVLVLSLAVSIAILQRLNFDMVIKTRPNFLVLISSEHSIKTLSAYHKQFITTSGMDGIANCSEDNLAVNVCHSGIMFEHALTVTSNSSEFFTTFLTSNYTSHQSDTACS